MSKYEINENLAMYAHSINSFRDYTPNMATNKYNLTLNEFNAAVEELKSKSQLLDEEKDEKLELIKYYADKYAAKLAFAINRRNSIEASCPSIMISGGSNFPVRKKEKQNAARKSFWSEYGDLFNATGNYYFKKIKNIFLNSTIYSGDKLAIEKLENKLADLLEKQENMKSANAHYRKNSTMKGYKDFSDETAEKIDAKIKSAAYTWWQQPYPSYSLTNNNGMIKNTRERLERLKKEKESGNITYNTEEFGFKVVENKDIMRLQLLFNGKPDETTRKLLKSNAFIWAPSQKAWQRQLTNNARYSLRNLIEKLKGEAV